MECWIDSYRFKHQFLWITVRNLLVKSRPFGHFLTEFPSGRLQISNALKKYAEKNKAILKDQSWDLVCLCHFGSSDTVSEKREHELKRPVKKGLMPTAFYRGCY